MSDNILQAIDNLATSIARMADCCEKGGLREGTATDPPAKTSDDVETGPGTPFPDLPTYYNAKCQVSNLIFDQVREWPDWLVDNHADLLAGVFGGITTGLVLEMVIGPVGWALAAVELSLVALAAYLVTYTISFQDILDALDDVQDELVPGLYGAGSAEAARETFVSILGSASPSLGTVEIGFIRIVLNNALLNELFDPSPETLSHSPISDIDCTATIITWDFAGSGQGWEFVDESDGTCEANGQWLGELGGVWRINLISTPGGCSAAWGTIYIDGLNIPVDASNQVQADFAAPTGGEIVVDYLKVIFSDETSLVATNGTGDDQAHTLTVNIVADKTITEIRAYCAHEFSSIFDYTIDILEVRVL